MLKRCADALALNPLDEADGQRAGQKWILGKVFEIAAAQRRALHVDPRPQDDVDAQANRLLGQGFAHLAQQVDVPTGGRAGGGRETGGRQALVGHGADIGHAAQAVGSVGHHQFRQVKPWHRRGRPGAGSRTQRGFFLQGHLSDKSLNIGHDRLLDLDFNRYRSHSDRVVAALS